MRRKRNRPPQITIGYLTTYYQGVLCRRDSTPLNTPSPFPEEGHPNGEYIPLLGVILGLSDNGPLARGVVGHYGGFLSMGISPTKRRELTTYYLGDDDDTQTE